VSNGKSVWHQPNIYSSNCKLCHEYNCYITLRWWYNEIFLKREEKQTIILADGTKIKGIKRLKALVVLGDRETGKTKFFESLVKPETRHKRIIHIKNTFHRKQFTLVKQAWFILLDDFNFQEGKDLECIKALVAGEPTVITAKWMHQCLMCWIVGLFLEKRRRYYDYK